jgi:hypothetical protein
VKANGNDPQENMKTGEGLLIFPPRFYRFYRLAFETTNPGKVVKANV